MPELAEVAFFRRRWDEAACGSTITKVLLHPKARIFRGADVGLIERGITGARFSESFSAAKQILIRFGQRGYLGLHLGMSGDLSVAKPDFTPGKHDHLVLYTAKHALVFNDPRMFGRVRYEESDQPPAWWTELAPPILSREFTVAAVAAFLKRRKAAPIKAVLLMQERFPGVGNWMADEILWRAAIHPRRKAGSLTAQETATLWKECRTVCRQALVKIAGLGATLPKDLNVRIPKTWLFWERWKENGHDPLTGAKLARAEIGGRTTAWSPERQRLPKVRI